MTSYKSPSIPSLPSNIDAGLRRFLEGVKESLEVRLSQRGNALDASPTFKDLMDAGILKLKDGVTVDGKSYSAEQLLGLVSFVLPDWITSDTEPPAPTGLAVTRSYSSMELTWDEAGFVGYEETQIYRAAANNLSNAVLVGATAGNSYVDVLPPEGSTFYYWIRHKSSAKLLGAFNATSGTSPNDAPGATALASLFDGPDIVLSWPSPTSSASIQYFIITHTAAYGGAGAVPVGVSNTQIFRERVSYAARTYFITPKTIGGVFGVASSIAVTVTPPAQPSGVLTVTGESIQIKISGAKNSLNIDRYEVWYAGVSLGKVSGNVFQTDVTWTGSRTFALYAFDTAGNQSSAGSIDFTPSLPTVTAFSQQVIDNNVLLSWTSTKGSLTISTHEFRRGATWAGGSVIGTKSGAFTTVFETVAGTFTYWVAAIDSAGNVGTPVSVVATVNQPPDYILKANYSTPFGGTKSNALLDSGRLLLPVNTTETVTQHFTNNGWASPQDQVNAGYPLFIQPGQASGYYEEIYDTGATLAANKITLSISKNTLAGTVAISSDISVSADGVSYTTYSGVTEVYATNFRYVKFRITATTANGGVCEITTCTVRLDSKLKTITGVCNAVYSDSGGTTVYLTDDHTAGGTKTFVDVDAITLTPLSTAARIAVYDFVDAANPLSLKVLLFDTAGARQSGSVSYAIRGF